jgi:SAM-dependent methyltransferase
MHPTAYENCVKFFNKYISKLVANSLKVVDFGSYDTNGCLKPIFKNCDYVGLDMSPGPNVDVVSTGDKTPFDSDSIDVIVSSSNFEHDDCFWMTFLEMARILKPGGYIYINAPSSGVYHGFPGDCWRFYADAGKALTKWANKNNINIQLIESYIDDSGYWKDNVSVYKKL